MTRGAFIEMCLIEVYGELTTDDAEVTIEMINNSWLNAAIGLAAKTCYKESIQIDGIGYVNNSFYTTFSGLAITNDTNENLGYTLTLPDLPIGIGRNEGISSLRFKGSDGFISQAGIPLSMAQQAYADNMRPIPNKILYWPEGNTLKMKSTLPLWNYTAVVKMISGGDADDLNSELNIPADYQPIMLKYIVEQINLLRNVRKDTTNDGLDMP